MLTINTKTEQKQYDAIVIGTGPGGEGAAMNLLKSGRKVAVVERMNSFGGGGFQYGTLPTKALRHTIQRMGELSKLGIDNKLKNLTFAQIRSLAQSVINQQTEMKAGFYQRNHAAMHIGEASFLTPNEINIKPADGAPYKISANYIFLAPGSRPYHPPFIDFSHPLVFDSDTILNLNFNPQHCIIYGAGVIGTEYASILRGVGISVTLVNQREQLLSYLDNEIIHTLCYKLMDIGVRIYHNENSHEVRLSSSKVSLITESEKEINGDILLCATGRTGNTGELNLGAIGIEVDSRGMIPVNETYQTKVPNIYAFGDVIGFPSLASASIDQGRAAAEHVISGKVFTNQFNQFPIGIYTSPEISCIGKTEQELTKEKIPYEVGHAWFKNIARAQITGNTDGMLKIIFNRHTYKILGIHCFGDQACEIIHIGQAIMLQEGDTNDIRYFTTTTFNYPSMAEAYRVAAFNGLNRLRKD